MYLWCEIPGKDISIYPPEHQVIFKSAIIHQNYTRQHIILDCVSGVMFTHEEEKLLPMQRSQPNDTKNPQVSDSDGE